MMVNEYRHTYSGKVQVEAVNPGPVRIFIGFLILVFLTWWWVSGLFTNLFQETYCFAQQIECKGDACERPLGNGTYFLFQILAGACWFVGSAAIGIYFGIIYVVKDIYDGVRRWGAERKAVEDTVTNLQNNVIGTVGMPVEQNTVPEPIPQPTDLEGMLHAMNERINRRASAAAVQRELDKINEQIKVLNEMNGIVPEPEPVPMTLESLAAMVLELKEVKETPAPKTTTRKRGTSNE